MLMIKPNNLESSKKYLLLLRRYMDLISCLSGKCWILTLDSVVITAVSSSVFLNLINKSYMPLLKFISKIIAQVVAKDHSLLAFLG